VDVEPQGKCTECRVCEDVCPADAIENAFDIGPNMVIVIIFVSLIFAVAWLLRRAIQLWIIKPKI